MAEEDPDDPQLKALRAVWLSMRDSDEDPPDSGVSALMAAARSQASMMAVAQAPWWKRMFDQLRRPPVLALASLVIVVCVGVLLANHHDAIEKAPTSAPVQEKELPHANLDLGGAPAPTAPSPTTTDGKAGDKKQDEVTVHRHVATHPSRTWSTSPPTVQPAAPRAEPAFESDAAETSAKAASGMKAETAPPPSRVLVDQLAAQARKAAQRGDCENAKAIATRIAGQDATYYRDHVAGDLAGCISTPAAADALH